jgi:beta-carotene 3-hydroxylase
MHGFMWYFHEDHHQPKYEHPFERNDIFFIILPSLNRILFYFGAEAGFNYLFLLVWVYCLWSCFMIHVLIHQRFKWFKNTNNKYLIGLRKAHKVHHKTWEKRIAKYSNAFVPFKYYQCKMS